MKKIIVTISIAIFFTNACKESPKEKKPVKEQAQTQKKSINAAFSIEILEKEGLDVIDPNAKIKVLASGFSWTEGPLWIEDGNFLLFSDIPKNKVYKLAFSKDTITYLYPSGHTGTSALGSEPGSNGLVLNKYGDLILLQHGDRRVAKMNSSLNSPKSDFITLIDNYMGKKLNSPNDGTFDKEDNFYFTDPPYGLPGGVNDPTKELDFQGVYCLLSTGDLVLLDKLSRPNGIAISPDQSTLYVSVSDEEHAVWYQYDIISPGKVTNRRLFYNVTHLIGQQGQQGLPDGMKTNSKGYLFATGPGGVWIFNSSGKALARIYTGQRTANCALSGDEKRLFLTADDYILSVALK